MDISKRKSVFFVIYASFEELNVLHFTKSNEKSHRVINLKHVTSRSFGIREE